MGMTGKVPDHHLITMRYRAGEISTMNIDVKLDPDIWKQIITIAEAVATEISLSFDSEGLGIEQQTSDKSNMISVRLPASEFISYDIDKDQVVRVGLGKLSDLKRRLAGVQMIHLHRENGGSMLDFVLAAENHTRKFSIPIIALTDEHKSARKMDDLKIGFGAEFKLVPDALENIMKDISLVAKRMKIQVEEDKLIFSAGDVGEGEVRVELEKGEELYSLLKGSKDLLATEYSIAILKEFKDALKASDPVFCLAHRKPMMIEMTLGDTGSARILLAPVLERRTTE